MIVIDLPYIDNHPARTAYGMMTRKIILVMRKIRAVSQIVNIHRTSDTLAKAQKNIDLSDRGYISTRLQ